MDVLPFKTMFKPLQIHSGKISICSIDDAFAIEFYDKIRSQPDSLSVFFPTLISNTKTLRKTLAFFEKRRKEWANKESCACLILVENEIAGYISVMRFHHIVKELELGYLIFEEYKNKGIATQALRLFSDYFLEDLKMKKVVVRIAEENISSKKVATNAGFVFKELKKNDFKVEGEYWIPTEHWVKSSKRL